MKKKITAAILIMSLTAPLGQGIFLKKSFAEEGITVERIAGKNRYETSALISRRVYSEAEKILVASGEDFPDALSAGVYANEQNMPILLSPRNGDLSQMDGELERLGAKSAVIVGGTAAVGQLRSRVIQSAQRVEGKNRYETAEKISENFDVEEKGYASGMHFPDALAAVPLLTKEKMPLLLFSEGESLRNQGTGYVFGGNARIKDSNIGSFERVSGANRYDTSVEIAKKFGDFDTVIIASGENFPDALSSGALSKEYNAPILLTPKKGLSAEVLKFLREKKPSRIIIAGGEVAVSSKVQWQLENIQEPEIEYSLLTSTVLPGEYQKEVQEAVELYHKQGRRYSDGMKNYRPLEPYIDFRSTRSYKTSPDTVQMDKNGIPMVKYNEKYYYNPVTIGQFALCSYAEFYYGERDEKEFLKAADKLLSYMDKDGALRYEFEWYNGNTKEVYPKGWTSSMAQGHALSCFTRAYELTKDPKYIEGGNRALKHLMLEKEKGGVRTTLRDLDPSLKDRIFFEEYVSTPNSYTLNGYIYTLLGLFDWASLTQAYPDIVGENQAEWGFNEGVESLQYVIHLYDVGGFTNYDLGYMNFDVAPRLIPGYHAIHIKLLHALYSITEVQRFKDFEDLWKTYV